MVKRVSLGRHALDGRYGLRVAPPGYSVDDPNVPLLFDTDKQQLQPVFVMTYGTNLQYVSTPPPPLPDGYGQWGGGSTQHTYRSYNTVSFPYGLGFVPLVLVGYDASFNGGSEVFKGFMGSSSLAALKIDATATSVTSELTFTLINNNSIDYTPTHTAYVYGVPYP